MRCPNASIAKIAACKRAAKRLNNDIRSFLYGEPSLNEQSGSHVCVEPMALENWVSSIVHIFRDEQTVHTTLAPFCIQ